MPNANADASAEASTGADIDVGTGASTKANVSANINARTKAKGKCDYRYRNIDTYPDTNTTPGMGFVSDFSSLSWTSAGSIVVIKKYDTKHRATGP